MQSLCFKDIELDRRFLGEKITTTNMPYIKLLFVEIFVYNVYELLCKAKSLVEESFEQ